MTRSSGAGYQYTLQALYQVERAPAQPRFEVCLDQVAYQLHPHEVEIISEGEGNVRIGLRVRGADVGEVPERVSRCLKAFTDAWRHCGCEGGLALRLLEAEQRFR